MTVSQIMLYSVSQATCETKARSHSISYYSQYGEVEMNGVGTDIPGARSRP